MPDGKYCFGYNRERPSSSGTDHRRMGCHGLLPEERTVYTFRKNGNYEQSLARATMLPALP